MVFSSLEFIFRFFPVFILIYYLTPMKLRNGVLFIGSLIFYAIGEPVYVSLLLGSCVVNYFIGRMLINDQGKKRKAVFILGILCNVSLLMTFKYVKSLVLPIGISFYTFQAVSYLADIYRQERKAEVKFFRFSTYLCMFPQLTAGPLIPYEQMFGMLRNRKYSLRMLEEGVKTFVWGLGAKVLLANRLGIMWNDIQTIGFKSISTPMAWLGAVSYSMQIYFDFLGYSLMAIGIGRLLGFYLPENFDVPYMAKSVTEFYRRWHMTLGDWFRKYIYIPLGGNKGGWFKTCRNLLLVWMLTGIWHGASLNFLLWGLVLGILIVLEKTIWLKWLNKSKILCHIYMIFLMPLTWMLFAITNFQDLGVYFGRLFGMGMGSVVINSADFVSAIQKFGPMLLCGVFFCTSLPGKLKHLIQSRIVETLILIVMFWLSIYYLYAEGMNPFMYFRF